MKELEKSKKRLATNLKQHADRERKDNTITFQELDVDQVFVDEGDLYKNLSYTSKMNRIAGLPNSDSNHAFDMFLKTCYLLEQAGSRVVFATGMPISNTTAEMYTMLRYLAPGLLQERGVEYFDAWAGNFANDSLITSASRTSTSSRQVGGLIRADFLLYDITFSNTAASYKRRKKADDHRYKDFCMVASQADEDILFLEARITFGVC